MLALSLALGCSSPDRPGSLVVISRADDGTYSVGPRDRGDLRDPRRLTGPLGHGYRGGRLGLTYHHGGDLDIRWSIDHGDAVPVDEEGLILWSFWYDLEEGRQALEDRGFDLDPIFPVSIAWSPESFLDLSAAENAAFVLGQRSFVLFPDALDDVPLAANAGVVRHELGHAFFELLVTGTSGGRIPWLTASPTDGLAVKALNEGFADMNATLTLDDPNFIAPSLPLESRDVTGDWVAEPDVYPPQDAGLFDQLGAYDPYRLGTVFASFVWDVREATDPDTAFELATGAVQAYGATGDWGNVDLFTLDFITAARGPAKDAACASAAERFPHLDLTTVCP